MPSVIHNLSQGIQNGPLATGEGKFAVKPRGTVSD